MFLFSFLKRLFFVLKDLYKNQYFTQAILKRFMLPRYVYKQEIAYTQPFFFLLFFFLILCRLHPVPAINKLFFLTILLRRVSMLATQVWKIELIRYQKGQNVFFYRSLSSHVVVVCIFVFFPRSVKDVNMHILHRCVPVNWRSQVMGFPPSGFRVVMFTI